MVLPSLFSFFRIWVEPLITNVPLLAQLARAYPECSRDVHSQEKTWQAHCQRKTRWARTFRKEKGAFFYDELVAGKEWNTASWTAGVQSPSLQQTVAWSVRWTNTTWWCDRLALGNVQDLTNSKRWKHQFGNHVRGLVCGIVLCRLSPDIDGRIKRARCCSEEDKQKFITKALERGGAVYEAE